MGLLVSGRNPAALKTAERTYFIATAGQTTFVVTNGYAPGEVDVFVNGVRMVESDDFYGVDGTNIVLTGATNAGDSVVVVSYYTFKTSEHYTKGEADLRYISAGAVTPLTGFLRTPNYGMSSTAENLSTEMTAGVIGQQGVGVKAYGRTMSTFGGDVHMIADSRGVGGSHKFYSWNGTSLTSVATIDSSGRMTRPLQPCFYAYNGAQQSGSDFVVQFTTTEINVGGHYNTSNYRFTAPISANYFFEFSAMAGTTTYNRYGLYKNGALYGGQKFSANQTYERFSSSWVISLNANDYVDIRSGLQGDGNVHDSYREFTGFLLS